MKAVYHGKLWTVIDDQVDCVRLEIADGGKVWVDYGHPDLIIDPTDDDILCEVD